MKRNRFIIPAALTAACALAYQGSFLVFSPKSDGITRAIDVDRTDSIAVSGANVVVAPLGQPQVQLPIADINDLQFANMEDVIAIDLNAQTVVNPYAFEGVTVTNVDRGVTITSENAGKLSFYIKGSGKFVKIYAVNDCAVTLDNVTLANENGAALNIQGKKTNTVTLVGDNNLSDGVEYTTPEGEKENGTLFSTGKLKVKGSGSLTVSGKGKHGIASSKTIEVSGGNITVTEAASDGLHADGITMTGGKYTCYTTVGDGIDAGKETLVINGADINITSTADDVKALKADGKINIISGNVTFSVAGAQSKGIKSASDIVIDGGIIRATMTGGVVVTNGAPSYCTAFKTDSCFVMNGGEIHVTSSGEAGKGISADGDATFNGGIVDISTTGNGAAYVDSLGVTDSYSATGITVDGNLYIYGGNLTVSAAGTAGKCIKSDLNMIIGRAGETGPYINAKTTGAKFFVSSGYNEGGGFDPNQGGQQPPTPPTGTGNLTGPGGGGPGGGQQPPTPPGGGGFDDGTDYANPKAIKAEGALTINSGTIVVTTAQDGGEGIESKTILTINGGNINCKTYDDCLNAKQHLQINGGVMQFVATGNDAIDSNGTMTITGGTILACGTQQPEESFDCDNNAFIITGGNLFGISGGGNSTPTTGTTQKYGTPTATASVGTRVSVVDASNNVIMSALNVSNVSNMKLFLSSPQFAANGSYRIMTGGTVTGGVTNHDITVGGTLSGATQATSFTAR